MAKGKKKSTSSGGPHKAHGPKRKLFHDWSSTMRLHLARAGLLKKEYNYESFTLACTAKGKRNVSRNDFNSYVVLPKEDKNNYFKNLKSK